MAAVGAHLNFSAWSLPSSPQRWASVPRFAQYPVFPPIHRHGIHSIHRALSDGAATAAAASPLAPALDISLHEALDLIHASTCSVSHGATTVVSGTGIFLGMESTWSLSVRPDGAFLQEISSVHMSSTSGYDGRASSDAWEIDSAGVPYSLCLDDHESVLLNAWVCGGVWTLPSLRERLHISMLAAENSEFRDASLLSFEIRLQGGKMRAVVQVDPSTWRPVRMELLLSGDVERWHFEDWMSWDASPSPSSRPASIDYPAFFLHDSLSGGRQELRVDRVAVRHLDLAASAAASAEVLARYSMPPEPLMPADATFVPGVPSNVPAWFSQSGHLLVKGSIDGHHDCGYFILDTGASGFVIEPSVAGRLGLPAFGEIHITGVTGKCKGRYRKGSTFQVGPLLLQDPIMMEMSCAGLVTGGPGPVIGIVG